MAGRLDVIPSVVWFKRDLRLYDHEALGFAAAVGPVSHLFIVEPKHWMLPDTSYRRYAFQGETIEDLRRQI